MPKTATVQYRYLDTDQLWEEVDLKAMVVDVLTRRRDGQAKADNAKLRIVDLDQDNSYVILNKLSDQETWDGPILCGQLIHLQSGADLQAVIQSLDEDTDEFLLQNIDLGNETRVLKGALYFALVGNHLGVIEGQQVKGRTLERYLTKLLQDAEEMEPGQAVILNAKFATEDGRRLENPAELTIAPKRYRANDQAEQLAQTLEREAAEAQERGTTVIDVLRMLGWEPEAIERLQGDVPDEGWLEGVFRVVIKQKGRKTQPFNRATVDQALRNIDPEDIGLKGNGVEKGGMMKLSTPKVVLTDGALIDPEDAMAKIVTALREWSEQGLIDCDFG